MEEAGHGVIEMTVAVKVVIRGEFSAQRVLCHASIAVFFSLVVIFSFGELNYYYIPVAVVAAAFYASSLRSRSLGLSSIGWALLGGSFILSFISSGRADDFTVTLSVIFLLVSYELTRFSFVLDSVVERSGALHEESLTLLRKVIRSHSATLAAVSSLALVSSVVMEYFSLGVIVVNPPAVGVTVFVVLTIFLVAFAALRRE